MKDVLRGQQRWARELAQQGVIAGVPGLQDRVVKVGHHVVRARKHMHILTLSL
jgi:hypothetical protein